MARFNFARAAISNIYGSHKVVNVPYISVASNKPTKELKKVSAVVQNFKYPSKSQEQVEQFAVDLSRHIFNNLTGNPTAVIGTVQTEKLDALVKNERQFLITYNDLVRKFYDETVAKKVDKRVPAHRGIKYLTDFITLSGARKSNALMTDHDTKAITEMMKFKKERT